MGQSWDDRYRNSTAWEQPNRLLTSFAGLIPTRGRALDLACGAGSNSVWLAERGLEVTGIDFSAEALRKGEDLAQSRGCTVHWFQADLQSYPLPAAEADIVVCFCYRDPALYPRIRAALRPGGHLFYETYTLNQLSYASGPRNPDHLLRPGELLTAFADWQVLFYRETWIKHGLASLVAKKPGTTLSNPM